MVKVLEDQLQLSKEAAELFVKLAAEAVEVHGKFTVALTGGSSPEKLYDLLATPAYRDKVDWSKVHVFWGDERWVPLDDDQSNAKMAKRTLLSKVPVPKENIFYMWADGKSPEEYAADYEQMVKKELGESLKFDLILLGMGPDGHTASLFPHQPVLHEQTKLVDAYYLAPQSMYRITLTAPLINKAKHIVVMLYGDNKANALYEVLEGEPNVELYPSQLLHPESGDITWLVDKAAAALLKKH
ncbi:6-phosphogluconolactonase [Mucilaginibacter sp. RS28]|uniref:6-phosphogluconolactonase n=1 Tax=Mucilaginibacter straminoryzae TaxID=2932774 RepID=A0A9X1X5W9_9SPHI|nr:6-phosphogluconolactonase [Mucilaginibacter straminoryzae]MCJ8209224.1 6-phosphogluconolactonase [Mucilaginibacter straminoryzae]